MCRTISQHEPMVDRTRWSVSRCKLMVTAECCRYARRILAWPFVGANILFIIRLIPSRYISPHNGELTSRLVLSRGGGKRIRKTLLYTTSEIRGGWLGWKVHSHGLVPKLFRKFAHPLFIRSLSNRVGEGIFRSLSNCAREIKNVLNLCF